MSDPLAAKADRARDVARRVREYVMKSLLSHLGRTGRPACLVALHLETPEGEEAEIAKGGDPSPRGVTFVTRHTLEFDEVERILPDVAEMVRPELPLFQVYRVMVDLGFASADVVAVDPKDLSFGFVRHVGTVEIRNGPRREGVP